MHRRKKQSKQKSQNKARISSNKKNYNYKENVLTCKHYPTNDKAFNMMHRLLHYHNVCIPREMENSYLHEEQTSDDEFEIRVNGGSAGTLFDMMRRMGDFAASTNYQHESRIQTEITSKNEMNRINKYRNENNHDNSDNKFFLLYIELTGIEPKIWRKIIVSSNISLAVFHDKILSVIFGWKRNYHAYQFRKIGEKNKNISYGPVGCHAVDMMHLNMYGNVRCGRYMIDSRFVFLSDLFYNINEKLRYIYDLGAFYQHTIRLDKIFTGLDKNYPVVRIINGKRHGPPEDCGGNNHYIETLNKLIQFCNNTKTQSQFKKIR